MSHTSISIHSFLIYIDIHLSGFAKRYLRQFLGTVSSEVCSVLDHTFFKWYFSYKNPLTSCSRYKNMCLIGCLHLRHHPPPPSTSPLPIISHNSLRVKRAGKEMIIEFLYRVFSLTWPASMQIYWNKRKRLHKKRVQLPQDWFVTPTWPPFHCFGTPIWPPWRHVKTLYSIRQHYRRSQLNKIS